MKILFSDNTLSGLLNFRGNVVREFMRLGHDVVLVAPQDALFQGEIPVGAKYIPVELSRTGTNPLKDLRYWRDLKKIYRAERPDYIFHFTIKPNIYGTAAAHSLRIRCSAMVAGLGHTFTEGGVGNRLARAMYRFSMRHAEHVLVLNQANFDTLLEQRIATRKQLILLPGGEGVDLAKYAAQPMPRNESPVFLMIGRLLYEKGYAEYVATAAALRGQAEFRLMGSLDSHPAAVQKATLESDVRQGLIQYIEHSPAVAQQIAAADCVVLPSYGEGFSRVLMEGAAMGRPLITTDIPGCRETVDDGVNGYLIAPRSSEQLIGACKKFIALSPEEREHMGAASRRKAERQFDINTVFEIYRRIIAATSRKSR